MVWPAVIAAGASIAGSLLSSGGGQNKGITDAYRAEDKRARERIYRTSVEDAKKAGLHPLFALGSSANFSPSGQYVSQTGSAAGEGIARAGEHIAEGVRQKKQGERQVVMDAASRQIHDLRITKMGKEIQLDDAELMKRASDLRMAEMQLLYWGDGGTGVPSSSGESRMYPYGTKTGPPLDQRPLVASARQSMPETVESVSPDGTRMQLLNPDLGLDEVGQAEYLRLKAIGWTSRQLTAWAARRRKIAAKRRRRVRRSDPGFYGGS